MRGDIKLQKKYDDMDAPVWGTVLALLIAVFFIVVGGLVEAEEDSQLDGTDMSVPYGDDCPYEGIDLTDLLYEAYDVYDVDMARWGEIAREMWRVIGAPVRYVGTYADDGYWVIVSEGRNGYYLQTGDDWTRGIDGQLHGVLCAVLVDEIPDGLSRVR